jgi:hypothetical protein
MNGTGFLAIWSSVERELETDYLHWMTREHAFERVSIPGFLGVRMFRARLDNERRYFILYRLADGQVVASAAYLARLNAPTAWSSRIMPNLQNFVRGGGRVIAESGGGRGATVLAIPCKSSQAVSMSGALGEVLALDRVVSARLLETDVTGSSLITTEKALRSGDDSFEALLVIEALDETPFRALPGALPSGIQTSGNDGVYDEVFALERSELGSVTRPL